MKLGCVSDGTVSAGPSNKFRNFIAAGVVRLSVDLLKDLGYEAGDGLRAKTSKVSKLTYVCQERLRI